MRTPVFGIAFLLAFSSLAMGQSVFTDSELRSMGLEEAWSAQILLDSRNQGVAHLAQSISSEQSQVIFEVSAGRRQWNFSERDLDVFRKPMGVEGARRAAGEKKLALQYEPLFSGLEATITEHVVPDISVVVATTSGVIQCLDGHTGRTFWSTSVGHRIHPTTGVCANDRFVGAINGSQMYVLNRADGQLIFNQPLVHTPAGPPVMTKGSMFVPMVGSLMVNYNLTADEHGRRGHPTLNKANSGGILPPVAFRDTVAWVADTGALFVANAYDRGVRFRVDANKASNTRPVFVPPNLVIFGSVDGYLYMVDEGSGQVVRRFSTGEPIIGSLFALGDHVFCITQDGGMFCASVETAREVWYAPGIAEIKGAAGGRLYCVDSQGHFTAIDAATGRRVARLKQQVLPTIHANQDTDRLFVTTRTGMVQALRPIGGRFPVAYEQADRKPSKKTQKKAGKAPAGAPAGGSTDEDPFKDSDDAPKAEKKEEMEEGADPFDS